MLGTIRNALLTMALALSTVTLISCGGGGGSSTPTAATTTGTDSQLGSVEGYVYASIDGDSSRTAARTAQRAGNLMPLSGATVSCEGKSATTDSEGYYKLPGLPPGERMIAVSKKGYKPFMIPVTVVKNSTVKAAPPDQSDVALEPEVSGAIAVTSTPEGALILIDGQETPFVTPNALQNIVAGAHEVEVALDDYDPPAPQTVTVTGGQTASVVFTLSESATPQEDPNPADNPNPGGSIPTPAGSYVIVDTNETACYSDSAWISCPSAGDSFFGQDAQYDGAQPSYTDNGDGTITDNVTGLIWQKDPGEKMTHDEAVAGAATFNLAGYTDWRLPTIKELYSLIQFSGMDPSGLSGDTSSLVPFIDTNYFDFQYGDESAGERIIDSQFTTSNVYVGDGFDDPTVFGVNFADGRIKGYGIKMFGGAVQKTFFVLYVRGNADYGVNDFADNGDGTIADHATGLTWQLDDSGDGMIWDDALGYCESLELGGQSDWRLPSVKELQSILDYTRAPSLTGTAAIDPLFNATSIVNEGGEADFPYYWSSTTHANYMGGGGSGAYMAFGRGLGYMRYSWVDVHGAGAQRSDPKSGDPTDYPTGHGPQGDAIRIYNYVRCVRGGATFNGTEGSSADIPTGTVQPPTGGGTGGGLGGPPQEATDACVGSSEGAACSFEAPMGTISGTCGYGMEADLICMPDSGPSGQEPPAGSDPKTGGDPGSIPNAGGPLDGPPQEAIDACSSSGEGAACSFEAPMGAVSGTCGYGMEADLICIPAIGPQ